MSIENAASLWAFSCASAASNASRSLKAMRLGSPVMVSLNDKLMDAVGRFRARAQIDDIGRKAAAHDQQDGADHGKAEHAGRDQIGRQRDGGVRGGDAEAVSA